MYYRGLAALLLSLVVSLSSYSLEPEDFSEASREDLEEAVIELNGVLNELGTENETLQTALNEAERQAKEAEKRAAEAERQAAIAERESETANQQLAEVRSSLNEVSQSFEDFRTEARRTKWQWGIAGAGAGLLAGGAGGFYLGVSIPLP